MKVLLGAVLIVILLYIVAGEAITSIPSIGQDATEGAGGRKLGYSTFKVTFIDQYLCYSYEHGTWVMSDYDTGNDCQGPFIDSVSLCNAMEAEGIDRVRLVEGRVLECS